MKNKSIKIIISSLLFVGLIFPVSTQGFSGLLTNKKRLEPITLSSGKPLAKKPYKLKSGKYYSIDFLSDGSAELAITGPDFFRNVWINEVVINDIEIRPLGIDSLEFDDEGKATISFVTIRPGHFKIYIPGTNSDSQSAIFIVE